MPNRGKYADLGSLRGPRRELALALRELCSLTGLGLRDLGKECNLSKSPLSDLLNGKTKRPDLSLLRKLYALAEKKAGKDALPLSLEELEQLCDDVLADDDMQELCEKCPAARSHGTFGTASTSADSKPAESAGRRPWPDTTLPVPRPAGDRQLDTPQEWLGIGDLATRLTAGQIADAAGILRHTALAAAAPETAAAIAACYRRGLDDAADAMIAYAAQRAGRDVMQITKALLDSDFPGGARELLELTLTL